MRGNDWMFYIPNTFHQLFRMSREGDSSPSSDQAVSTLSVTQNKTSLQAMPDEILLLTFSCVS